MNLFVQMLTAFGLIVAGGVNAAPPDLLARVDHLVYATPDLVGAVDKLEGLLGVRATTGGQHPGRGTRNALIALGPASYIEIIGPDPDQPAPAAPRNFGIDHLPAPKLVTWAAKSNDLPGVVKMGAAAGVTFGDIGPGSRRRPDGVLLNWKFTNPLRVVADGIVPFFIDWGSSPHPAATAASGCSLVDLRAEHPDPDSVQKMLKALELDLVVTRGSAPALIATVSSPHGRVELR